jgi:hypothetical protein
MVIVAITCSQQTKDAMLMALHSIREAIAYEIRISEDQVEIYLLLAENPTSAVMMEVEITYPQTDWRVNIYARIKSILGAYNKILRGKPVWDRYLLKLTHYLGGVSWYDGNLQ